MITNSIKFFLQRRPLFNFCVISQRKVQDRAQLVNLLKTLYDEKKPFNDLQLIAMQLSPYFGEFDNKQYQTVTQIFINTGLYNDNMIQRIIQRGYYFLDIKQLSLENFLKISDSLLTGPLSLKENEIRLLVDTIQKVNFKTALPVNLVYTLSLAGKLKHFMIFEDEKLNEKLLSGFRDICDLISHEDVGKVAIALALLNPADEQSWDKLEDHVIHLKQEVSFQELVRVATASLMAGDKGSKFFWKFFFDQFVEKLPSLTVDEITQGTMAIVQGAKEESSVMTLIEQAFTNRYQEFDTYNSILMFASFGSITRGKDIWNYFETDLPGFFQDGDIMDVSYMISNVINVFPRLTQGAIEMILAYTEKNGSQFKDDIKDQIKDVLRKQGYLSETLEQVLDKTNIWV